MSACSGSTGDSANAPSAVAAVQPRPIERQIGSSPAAYQDVVQELYIAYFGRPADPGGLVNFETQLYNAQAPTDVPNLAADYATNPKIKALIDSFGTSKESQTLYGSNTTEGFVDAVFQNVVGRQPLPDGQAFWVDAINGKTLSQGNAALGIMSGALTNNSTQGGFDAQLIANRRTVAEYFTTQLLTLNLTAVYSGSDAAGAARVLLSDVASATDTTAYQTNVISAIAALPNPNTACVQSYPGEYKGTLSGSSGTVDITLTTDTADSTLLDATGTMGGLPIIGRFSPSFVDFTANCSDAAGNLDICMTATGTLQNGIISGNWYAVNNLNGTFIAAKVCP